MKAKLLKIILATITTVISVFFLGEKQGKIETESQLYGKVAVITEVNYKTDIVTIEDATGNVWEINDCDDWQVGDCVAMVLHANNTSEIYDDKIISLRYSSFNTKTMFDK